MTIQKILLTFPPERKNLLRAIKAINQNFGLVSREAVGIIARYFKVSETHVFSVASFYDEINLEKPVLVTVEICDSSNCHTKNSDKVIEKIENFLKLKTGSSNRNFKLKRMSCLGRCPEGPVVRINGKVYTRVTTNKIIGLIENKLGL